MVYPQSFIDRVKRAYPDSATMHKLADSGADFLGRYLDDSSSSSISLFTLRQVKSMEELRKLIDVAEEKKAIYARWTELYRKERGLTD